MKALTSREKGACTQGELIEGKIDGTSWKDRVIMDQAIKGQNESEPISRHSVYFLISRIQRALAASFCIFTPQACLNSVPGSNVYLDLDAPCFQRNRVW